MDQCNTSSNEAEGDKSQKEEILGLNKVVVLNYEAKAGKPATFYIVGTAHIARNSCDKVGAVIQSVKPDVRMLPNTSLASPLLSLASSSSQES